MKKEFEALNEQPVHDDCTDSIGYEYDPDEDNWATYRQLFFPIEPWLPEDNKD